MYMANVPSKCLAAAILCEWWLSDTSYLWLKFATDMAWTTEKGVSQCYHTDVKLTA